MEFFFHCNVINISTTLMSWSNSMLVFFMAMETFHSKC